MRAGTQWLAAAGVVIAISACAVEDEPEGRFDDDGDGGSGLESPASGVGGASHGVGGGASSTTAATTTSSGSGGCSHASPNGCLSADSLEEMAGDQGGDLRVVKGTTSRFVKVFVAEKVSSIVSFPELKLTARLDNSPGMDFDLIVHDAGAEPSCEGESYEVSDSGAYVTATWGDSKNSDDGRWWVLEVKHASGTHCGSAAEWTLTLAGNYAPSCATDGACTTDDDCVCSDCHSDGYCSNPQNCNDDGVCDTYDEGCVCGDCAGTPACL